MSGFRIDLFDGLVLVVTERSIHWLSERVRASDLGTFHHPLTNREAFQRIEARMGQTITPTIQRVPRATPAESGGGA